MHDRELNLLIPPKRELQNWIVVRSNVTLSLRLQVAWIQVIQIFSCQECTVSNLYQIYIPTTLSDSQYFKTEICLH